MYNNMCLNVTWKYVMANEIIKIGDINIFWLSWVKTN
jgi:hypothetical protein